MQLPSAFEGFDRLCAVTRVLGPLFVHPWIQFMSLRLYLLLYWHLITQAGLNHFYRSSGRNLLKLSERIHYKIGKFALTHRNRFSETLLILIFAGISIVSSF